MQLAENSTSSMVITVAMVCMWHVYRQERKKYCLRHAYMQLLDLNIAVNCLVIRKSHKVKILIVLVRWDIHHCSLIVSGI